ncbi:beta-ketoacyl-[acyl-carrier-protein] synthase family protein [Streptomyces sp. NPDC050418]|uniref:beta-ketoacyl-[acyl-carrier-protein] synthase family protein n=1 Tax=Streptomyces sp. NPDC050418 TaxID=3365612 RepID=UPI0037B6C20C
MNDTAVAVTGLGALTPLGMDAGTTWEGLLAGASGVRRIEEDWADDVPVGVAAPLPGDPAELIGRVQARKLDRCEQVALLAAREAWQHAGAPDVDGTRLAVVIGTGTGGVLTTLGQDDTFERSGARRLSPYAVPMLMPNGPAAWVSMELGAKAGAHTPVSACASGAEAIAMGLDLIRAGRADVVVAGGAEACLHPFTLSAFAQMKALSPREEDPEAVSRPFDADRSGFVMGEGAGIVILERASFAAERGARVHGWLAGAGVSSSAAHITASDVDGQAQAMRAALASAGVAPGDIGFVQAHATSTPSGDVVEAEALASVLGPQVTVTAAKSQIGHLCGASGAVAAVAAVLGLRDGAVPAIRNLDTPDPAVTLDLVKGGPREGRWDTALSNAFGFGGHNVSLVFRGSAGG